MAHIRRNMAKRKLAEGGVVSVALGPMTPDLIEHFGLLDFDAIWLEGEHGPVDFGDVPDLTRACDLWGKSSIVRVNQHEPGVIYRTLDLGAQGVAVPHVNTAAEARAIVDAAKFGPIGHRGSATSRQGIGVDDYFSKANDETMIVVLIEDIAAVHNLDSILEVDHIDVFFVAPGDLAQSMGHPGSYAHPEVTAVVEESIRRIAAAGRVPGTLVNESNVRHYVGLGARFFSTGWIPWLIEGARRYLSIAGEPPPSRG